LKDLSTKPTSRQFGVDDQSGSIRPKLQSQSERRIRVAFVTNICPHYRVRTFELLAKKLLVTFFFYSAGDERYWRKSHRARAGNFPHHYLSGFHITQNMRVVLSLPIRLLRGSYDVIIKCINGRFALPVTYVIAKLRRKPFILWTGIWMTLDTPFHRLAFPLTRWIYRHADAIVVYGEHVKRYLVSLNIASEKIFVAAHAVDNPEYNRKIDEAEKAALRERLGVGDHKIVLYLGRLEEEKGVAYLIKAFALLKVDNLALVIVGDGSMQQRLKQLTLEERLEERTRFVGYVSPEEALTYYAIADLFVVPSITMPSGKEPWGLVVNEAMNQGLPVIATDAVGAAAGGLVQSGTTGLVVPERDSPTLTQAMDRIISDDRLREKMSADARRVVAGWNNERMVKGFQQAIEYAIRRNRRCGGKENLLVSENNGWSCQT
jgi:glycosyltransferase involved in cell wall biosynthesis